MLVASDSEIVLINFRSDFLHVSKNCRYFYQSALDILIFQCTNHLSFWEGLLSYFEWTPMSYCQSINEIGQSINEKFFINEFTHFN